MARENLILDVISTQSRFSEKFIQMTLEKYERIVTGNVVEILC